MTDDTPTIEKRIEDAEEQLRDEIMRDNFSQAKYWLGRKDTLVELSEGEVEQSQNEFPPIYRVTSTNRLYTVQDGTWIQVIPKTVVSAGDLPDPEEVTDSE